LPDLGPFLSEEYKGRVRRHWGEHCLLRKKR